MFPAAVRVANSTVRHITYTLIGQKVAKLQRFWGAKDLHTG